MKIKIILLGLSLFVFSCKNNEELAVCQLTKFITDFPATSTLHHDVLTLKDKRVIQIYSYDLRNYKDTVSRQKIFYEYDALGKVSKIRDESASNRIITFEFVYENGKDFAEKIIQKVNNVQNNVISVEYDSKGNPTSVESLNLIGVNRTIEYDNNGNPFRVIRSDFGTLPSVNEHTFDDKRNFFAGIPEIGYYWLLRPLYNYIPFGPNNIVGTKFYTVQNLDFKEVPDNRTVRETNYNEQGFPTTMNILLENQGKTLYSASKFEYNCQ
ncbi:MULTISPECIES: hypothetical protein [Emticicia]|uniref:hypothetical protein n=1 Tax=Emticicia TaxID=312278 RepID=UPI0007D8BA0B|nr:MULTISPECIES: hypothetical protein [Emticicia]